MKEKTILHSDVNNFFASVECATNPDLKDKPVAVAGNPKKRTGIILAKNELAKKFGVKTGQAIWEAKKNCPDLVTVSPHYEKYKEISTELHKIYLDYTDLVEPMGLDECWLDVTHSLKCLNKTGEEIANEIRARVKDKLNLTVSVGVSFSKLFAKLGSDMKKPDATTIISKENFKNKAYNLPLNSIIGIGRRFSTKLEKMNVNTISDFVNLDINFIRQIMGKPRVELQEKLKGNFDEEVMCYYNLTPPKSVGNGTTMIEDIINKEDIHKVVCFLSEKIALRMSKANLQAKTISVSLKTNDFKVFSHSETIFPIETNEEISFQAMQLIDKFWKYDKYLRSIRINLSNLIEKNKTEQLSLFDNKDNENLNESLKSIKNKYGNDKIFLASDSASFINKKTKDEDAKG